MKPSAKIDVGTFLAGLLYQHETVVLPGLGRFVTRYKPAEIDRVQGKLFPPSKKLVFQPQTGQDDGRLSERVRDRYGLSQEEAERMVQSFVSTIRDAIRQREIVVFPEVGRLYEDYQHNLQFIPDSTNFNPATYGLPALNYQVSSGKTLIQRADPPVRREETVPPTRSQRLAAAMRRNSPVLLAAAALILALLIYLFIPKQEEVFEPEVQERVIPQDRLNRPPLPEDLNNEPGTSISPQLEDELDTEASTPPPSQASAIIAIGLFQDQENIDRLVREIYEEGYEPYIEAKSNATLIGIQRAYDDDEDLQRALADIRNLFVPDAFILRKGD